MAIMYEVKIDVLLKPIGCPWIRASVGNQIHTQQLQQPTEISFNFSKAIGPCALTIEHFDKAEYDAVTAVSIEKISFFGINDLHFVWAGIYVPNYPDHYSDKKPLLPGQNYLGWNGTYILNFEVPVFTWIHRTLNLGWLYK